MDDFFLVFRGVFSLGREKFSRVFGCFLVVGGFMDDTLKLKSRELLHSKTSLVFFSAQVVPKGLPKQQVLRLKLSA